MSTPAQKEFLVDHINGYLDQTQTAEDQAVDLLQQITARRLHRMLIGIRVWVEELPEDGDDMTVWKTPVGVSMLGALGFEEPG
jgi:hypothetical protein